MRSTCGRIIRNSVSFWITIRRSHSIPTTTSLPTLVATASPARPSSAPCGPSSNARPNVTPTAFGRALELGPHGALEGLAGLAVATKVGKEVVVGIECDLRMVIQKLTELRIILPHVLRVGEQRRVVLDHRR